MDGGIGISAAVAVGSKFIERSKFTARHEASYDKEVDKSIKLGQRFDIIPKEDIDEFEFQEYNLLRSNSLHDLRHYRDAQEAYKQKEWYKEPMQKLSSRGRVREGKRRVQSSSTREGRHVDDLETYSRSNSSRCSSVASFGSDSGLGLERNRPYRNDSISIRAMGGSPPSASLDDIALDERKDMVINQVSHWLSSVQNDDNNLSNTFIEHRLPPSHSTLERHMHPEACTIDALSRDQDEVGSALTYDHNIMHNEEGYYTADRAPDPDPDPKHGPEPLSEMPLPVPRRDPRALFNYLWV
ncbi:hypothetical protein GALMADRAFT_151352 [Galerina marginata CBS 339.88]|uniref:Uncharacterized protein n=1 Tax=Galerina marginata (strain CBS 339.88) TaxID=685588 RepID=A0A067TZI8_GALM3|nr:hypothetical protein GALMADRAFT_151352 [Galerina marginata CBS 339.88]